MKYAKPAVITRVSPADLEFCAFSHEQIAQLTDIDMEYIAGKMANAYLESNYWIDLSIIAEDVLKNKKL